MPGAGFVPSELEYDYAHRWTAPAAGATDNGKVWAWNNVTGKYAPASFLATSAVSAFGLTLIDDADAATARGTLGLGTAAVLNVGTSANNVVQLNGSAQLPAVSGALLTNLPAGSAAGSNTQVQYNSSGVFAGHSGLTYDEAGVLTVSGRVVAPVIRPPMDGTAAWQVQTAAGTPLATVDTTNRKFALNAYLLADRWLGSVTNLFIGDDSAGAGVLSHASGNEGWYNIGLGVSTLRSITTGYANMAIGSQALRSITTGYANMAIGRDAATTIRTGANNVAIGASAGNFGAGGFGNIAIGAAAASGAGDSNYNIAIGYSALSGVTNGSNVAIGQLAAGLLRSGTNNVAIGAQAGQGGGSYNSNNNTFIGYQAGYAIATNGGNNTFIGYQAGDSVTTGANNLLIGYGVDAPAATTSYYLNIGNLFTGDLTAGALKHGFYGVAPVARQLLAAGTGATVDDVITALQNLGLLRQS